MNIKSIFEDLLYEEIELPNKLLIVDIESTCWKNEKEKGDQKSEIIEIGYCAIVNDRIGERGSIFVKPQFSAISPFCTQLTGITSEKVKKSGFVPKIAFNKFKSKFNSNVWASYGFYDKKHFERMFKLYKLPNILPRNHINVKGVISKRVYGSNDPYKAKGVMKSLEKFGMQFKGSLHSGKDDAYNIALLYLKLKEIGDKNGNRK